MDVVFDHFQHLEQYLVIPSMFQSLEHVDVERLIQLIMICFLSIALYELFHLLGSFTYYFVIRFFSDPKQPIQPLIPILNLLNVIHCSKPVDPLVNPVPNELIILLG